MTLASKKQQQPASQLGNLNRVQEVLYQKEFKRADRAYNANKR